MRNKLDTYYRQTVNAFYIAASKTLLEVLIAMLSGLSGHLKLFTDFNVPHYLLYYFRIIIAGLREF